MGYQCYLFQGALLHLGGERDSALAHFSSSRRLSRAVEAMAEGEEGEDGDLSAWAAADCLQWELECRGREGDVQGCRECLEEQVRGRKKSLGTRLDVRCC